MPLPPPQRFKRCSSVQSVAMPVSAHSVLCLAVALAVFAASVQPALAFQGPLLTWTSPTKEPSRNTAGGTIVGGGMPIGNGQTTALVFPLVPGFVNESTFAGSNFTLVPDSVSFIVSSSQAMASDTSLFALGMVSVEVPGLFSANGGASSATYFEQTLNTSDACEFRGKREVALEKARLTETMSRAPVAALLPHARLTAVTVKSSIATVRVWVPAHSDTVRASVASAATGKGVPLKVTVQTLRPSKRFEYGGQFLVSDKSVSDPDDWDSSVSSSGLATVVLSHRNRATDVPSSAFNETLVQQGLSQASIDKLSAGGSDQWKDRQFGWSTAQ